VTDYSSDARGTTEGSIISIQAVYVHVDDLTDPALATTSEEDRQTVARARKVERFPSQPFFVAEVVIDSPDEYVSLADSIDGFTQLLEASHGHCLL
jgi:F0F1-type ATP synthase beta subunit